MINRIIQKELLRLAQSFPVVTLTGPRQSKNLTYIFFLCVLFLLPHYCPAQDTVSITAGFLGRDGCNRSMDLKMDTLTIHMRGDTSVTLAMLYYIDSTDEYFNWGGTIYPKVISQSICIVVDGIVVGGKHLDSLPIDKHAKISNVKKIR